MSVARQASRRLAIDRHTLVVVVRGFLCLPPTDRRAVLWVLCQAVAAEILVRTATLPTVAQVMGVQLRTDATVATETASAADVDALALTQRERVRLRGAQRLMRHWPFCSGTCLREALVCGRILRERDPHLIIGVGRSGNSIAAHAWLDVQGARIGDAGKFVTFERLHTARTIGRWRRGLRRER